MKGRKAQCYDKYIYQTNTTKDDFPNINTGMSKYICFSKYECPQGSNENLIKEVDG